MTPISLAFTYCSLSILMLLSPIFHIALTLYMLLSPIIYCSHPRNYFHLDYIALTNIASPLLLPRRYCFHLFSHQYCSHLYCSLAFAFDYTLRCLLIASTKFSILGGGGGGGACIWLVLILAIGMSQRSIFTY